MPKSERTFWSILIAMAVCLAALPVSADVGAFIANVSFDDEANLDSAPGIGIRWGKSSGLFGGETSLLISRPERSAGGSAETSTAFFYEGRFLVNIPAGTVKPFIGVGFGAITITGADLTPPDGADDAALQAFDALSQLQTNSAFSYGAGVRYALNERIDGRVDLRQYQVLSVKSIVESEVAGQLGYDKKKRTVQHTELSVGVVFRF